ncbi:hypothetical protein [Actinomadura madurae]|uniref:hypothetical protein n=1 Tax=Actinomadura madurae TaxID=1993 RepID=UPI0020D2622A|nr:hypothetical protein [Actinomadura madurae]MCP9976722.1 hypothetical protein [Actinomadura madurae]
MRRPDHAPARRQHAVEAVAVERLRPVPGDEPRVDVERPAGERGRPGLGQDPVREAAQLPPGRRRGVARVDGGGGEVGEGPGERVVQEPGRHGGQGGEQVLAVRVALVPRPPHQLGDEVVQEGGVTGADGQIDEQAARETAPPRVPSNAASRTGPTASA